MYSYQRLRAALQDAAPAITFVLTLGAALWLHLGSGPRGRVFGFAEALPEMISPVETARVASIEVTVGQQVEAGQVIATLDTSVIDAEIAVAKAEKTQVEADLQMEMAVLEQELDANRETVERHLAVHREEQRRAIAEAKVLDSEISRVKQLVENRQAVLDDLTKLDLQHASVTAIASEKPRTLSVLTEQLKATERRRNGLRDRTSGLAAKLDADVRVKAEYIAMLEQRRATYVLRAANAGHVTSIDKQPGDVVPAGEPLVQLLSARTGARAVACVPERFALGVNDGDAAELWIRGQLGDAIPGTVVAVGPLVSQLPPRCWPTPEMPAWGRVVTISLDAPMALVPGQAFDITFDGPRKAGAPPKTTGTAPKPDAAPKPGAAPKAGAVASQSLMKLPPTLASRTRFEPSGVLARPGESRYLIVSDDTGHEQNNEGAPWLFTMSASGAVAADPVPVSGVDELNDVEGIAAGDAGETYLLSSQSYSKKGKRKPERTALLRLRQDGQGFRVDGEIHLAEVLDADPARAAALGLPDGTRALDIEGLAFRQGALYLGLKAPLDPQGNAMIWRVSSPAALFGGEDAAAVEAASAKKKQRTAVEATRFDAARVSLWARARVDVELAGRPAPGGISELVFMPDGALAMTSTPSTADGDAGALWRVDHPEGGVLSPRLVQRFPGLKPEGITPSLTPGALTIVFDTGNTAAPSFQELSWGP
ncbi:HlyD family efflux transporter periplasmic adaptor subunit [Sorangium sp. So ce375]|uniref:HlyD family secretion protein n=1 Tax=Sorangium sp. So ce375 TaxID=3133306 RepID=UPI003F5B42CE